MFKMSPFTMFLTILVISFVGMILTDWPYDTFGLKYLYWKNCNIFPKSNTTRHRAADNAQTVLNDFMNGNIIFYCSFFACVTMGLFGILCYKKLWKQGRSRFLCTYFTLLLTNVTLISIFVGKFERIVNYVEVHLQSIRKKLR